MARTANCLWMCSAQINTAQLYVCSAVIVVQRGGGETTRPLSNPNMSASTRLFRGREQPSARHPGTNTRYSKGTPSPLEGESSQLKEHLSMETRASQEGGNWLVAGTCRAQQSSAAGG
ncbi:hypothetical protein EYF80_038150 [Liparis tanakae]|uniref:Uncharacterized protein n=1 Tax=Liparis tanakae TaxID=230148 RepID=A0A4Z2GFX2_9TELE|nr:hypothetical protein EYF80_038150 [Liparis tanakae]